MAKEHGAAVVAMTIDEEGMAQTAERKLEIAKRISQICTQEYGLRPEALIFDTLTFPLTTGQEELQSAAVETLEGIRLHQGRTARRAHHPGRQQRLLRRGPAARAVLNSVFLYHAVQAGLDMAIVNPAHITPYAEIAAEQRELADDLIFESTSRRAAALHPILRAERRAEEEQEKADPTEGMTADEQMHWQILHRKKEGVEALIDQSLLERLVRSTMRALGQKPIRNWWPRTSPHLNSRRRR